METLLMIVTVVALALAIGMSVLAWRLIRENRWRSAARAEALQAMAAEPHAHYDHRWVPDERFTEIEDEPAGAVVFAAAAARPSGAPKRRWLALAIVAVVMAALAS